MANFLRFLLFSNKIFDWHWDCSRAAWIRALHGKTSLFSYSYSFRGSVFALCRCAQELQSRTWHLWPVRLASYPLSDPPNTERLTYCNCFSSSKTCISWGHICKAWTCQTARSLPAFTSSVLLSFLSISLFAVWPTALSHTTEKSVSSRERLSPEICPDHRR